MKTLYLMRHGETLFNQQKKIQGWCDSPLTELGKKQAEIAHNYFLENRIELDSAYASTSERACDTLELVTDLAYSRVKGLKEWNFGDLEAEHEYLNPPLPYGDFFVDFGGEGELEFRARVSQTIFDLVQADAAETILMVSHGASCRQFMRTWDHVSQIDLPGRIANCCILKFAFEQDQFELLEVVNHDFTSVL
ncbi:hypothetical protein IGI39_004196 [Enterococcus sp. AZ135]|uniref:histidine phosphatase family protein n=1 Tax=unclassified Enterococcus TaxID=2608891 RepID=UPI003F2600FF